MSERLIMNVNKFTGTTVYYTKNKVSGEMLLETEYKDTDVSDVVNFNQASRELDDGKYNKGTFHKVASIPQSVFDQWKRELGGENPFSECHKQWVKDKLNSTEYSHLRTKKGRL
jgi:hypothetical protein